MPTITRPTALDAPAYLALARALKTHPALGGRDGVRTWKTWEGGQKDDAPFVQGQEPAVRLTPLALPAQPHSRSAMATPLRVLIETAVAPRDFAGAAQLWRRLYRALFLRDDRDTRRLIAQLEAAGCRGVVLEQPALPAAETDYGEGLVTSQGSIVLLIFTSTR